MNNERDVTVQSPESEAFWEVQNAQAFEALKKFRMLFNAVQLYSQWVESQCGVSSAQLWVLWELNEKPGIRVSDLAKAMSIHQSTASNLLDKLEKRHLIKRERNGADQRVVRLYLTDDGQGALVLAPKPARGVLQNALFNLPADALQSLNKDLGILLEQMKIRDDDAAMEPLSS